MQLSWRRLRQNIPAFIKGTLRRQAGTLLPSHEVSEYRAWITRRLAQRQLAYTNPVPPGLLSLLTAVWDGSPLRYLKTLANSIIEQNEEGTCEWVLLDNGCSHPQLRAYLERLSRYPWVQLHRMETNVGITRGLHYCLEHAANQYIVPVDADDYLYPDALRILSAWIENAGYPVALYSDEDKIIGTRFYQPYLKPDWDPVLLANSAYIAHLGAVQRTEAIKLGAYTDPATEGSPDWDLFMRLMLAGHAAVHIPEVLYSWRVHARSTADDAAIKPYVQASQKAVLQRFLEAKNLTDRFTVENSPLLNGMAHWHFSRRQQDAKPLEIVRIHAANARSDARALQPLARQLAAKHGFIAFLGEDVALDHADWTWEAFGLFELHPDTAMVGGRIANRKGVITEAGRYFGYGGVCGCPHRGRPVTDPGYFTQMWKQRSVSAVSTQFAVADAAFLAELLDHLPRISLAYLGVWAGAYAFRTGKRIVYSPFLSGVSELDWEQWSDPAEQAFFADLNRDLIPDHRFYSRCLSLQKPFAFADQLDAAPIPPCQIPSVAHC